MQHADMVEYKRRNLVQFWLIMLAQSITLLAIFLTHLNTDNTLPPMWTVYAIAWYGVGIAVQLIVQTLTPYADPIIIPVVLLLNGLGLAMIHRLDLVSTKNQHDLLTQFVWTIMGLILFLIVMFMIQNNALLAKYPYLFFVVGLILLLLPLVPFVGRSINGARLWVGIGGFSFQPGEFAKIALTIAFAGYLAEKKDVLALAGRKFLGIEWPRPRDLGPILIMWVAAVVVLVAETDLGSSLLFFGLFVVMLYVSTQRSSWAILGILLFLIAAVGGYTVFAHVRRRFNAWLDPFSDYDHNTQIIQAAFGIDYGGLIGQGWNLGSPWRVSYPKSDMIISSLTEEIGLAGFMALVMLYLLVVMRGLRIALITNHDFDKLLATGLAFTFALQVFTIIGGVTRALPLTGLTTPFMSKGGTSIVANYVIIALLITLSHQARKPKPASDAQVYANPIQLMEVENEQTNS